MDQYVYPKTGGQDGSIHEVREMTMDMIMAHNDGSLNIHIVLLRDSLKEFVLRWSI